MDEGRTKNREVCHLKMLLLIETKFTFWLTAAYIEAYSVLFNY